ncbi:hypothetical protein [Wolbachia endosymbiont of Psylliodes chrysocephala]|uniref:hypothetical protein n=1 Tax=Wolbachia endosymbiont of Psylliodes chrysocephala TaxID=2883236 RepID=UPI00209C91E6|nr:hypothetical protein [Wolbachia endosymbiont of Psylliodes chrysocephala]
MVTGGISKPEQVFSAKTNPKINETLEGLPKKLEKEQVGGEYELIKRRLYAHYKAFFIECSIGKMVQGP